MVLPENDLTQLINEFCMLWYKWRLQVLSMIIYYGQNGNHLGEDSTFHSSFTSLKLHHHNSWLHLTLVLFQSLSSPKIHSQYMNISLQVFT